MPKITTTVEPTPVANRISLAPSACIITQGPRLGIPTDWAMEVIDQVESTNFTIQQASWILLPAVAATPPTAVLPVAATPPIETVTLASSPQAKDRGTDQTLLATAQNASPATGIELPVVESMAVNKIMHPVNEDVSIIEESPFLMATALQPPNVGLLCEIHQCEGLVINFPSQELISSNSNKEEI
uniref:Uncharacterized protein n=1 Tax=Romanomermis culicivorax TaxID=13658 RepID=A0A915JQ14_ROMCU